MIYWCVYAYVCACIFYCNLPLFSSPLFVGMMLRKLGHDVQEAINGAEVI